MIRREEKPLTWTNLRTPRKLKVPNLETCQSKSGSPGSAQLAFRGYRQIVNGSDLSYEDGRSGPTEGCFQFTTFPSLKFREGDIQITQIQTGTRLKTARHESRDRVKFCVKEGGFRPVELT